ncbi:MAG TPA: hypothetical protein VJ846_11580 [Sphingomicrobium sp.]|nr:hypothetical protein [Sphingomicrobium sp.]
MIVIDVFCGIIFTAFVAILIVLGANPPRGYQPLPSTKLPPPPGVKPALDSNRISCHRQCGNRIAKQGEMHMICQKDRCGFLVVRDADFWDIANHEPEAGRVEYRFLGITGFEDD